MGCSQILVLWVKSEIPTLAHQLIPLDPSTLKIASLGAEDVSKINYIGYDFGYDLIPPFWRHLLYSYSQLSNSEWIFLGASHSVELDRCLCCFELVVLATHLCGDFPLF